MAIVGSVESQYYKVVIYITWNGVTYMYIMVINIMVLNVIKCFPRNGKGKIYVRFGFRFFLTYMDTGFKEGRCSYIYETEKRVGERVHDR